MYLMERSQGQGKHLLMTKGISANPPLGEHPGLLRVPNVSMGKRCLKTLSQEVNSGQGSD